LISLIPIKSPRLFAILRELKYTVQHRVEFWEILQ
jgi:hypothetical protein